ncbi:MAG: diadenylate cyclase CdaA [Thermodesulfovibrio sp.]|uniref:diadenylate cyclase CdaA n=1 Tax=unclassified Thermodesulfovibrio TaxID=2645936 RepID=UPI00083AC116|nr:MULTISPECIES: diadenylate cyclase CdaA [unclassified Thermodesulfovibrio]MDI1472153.1 diadenylate cyclase CdaA [Thermodesulfovibrio sp. 1176]MDI6715246.1 diadenylate cyclase CdaA [Thermodesulfovibrio sp.]ODA45097.1 Diadenylate cyclase spyDAC [Thermodesulfovibrio sp. N1]
MEKFFSQLRWQDLIDIAVVSFIIYKIFILVKGTRAARMLIGVGVLLALSLFSRFLELYTLDWLIQSFWTQIIIVLIILFQPEIRKALAQMGETPLFHRFSSAGEMKTIEEIVKAAQSLANKKIGALIVFERDVSLGEYIEIGVPLDAKVTKELLISIFHPTSPIHDGAVIIKGNKILAAGCFLPIKLGADLKKTYGTRHRAALGITEETDAVAVIVSEETGAISLAVNGQLEINLDIGKLRQSLTNLFTTERQKR